MVNLQKFLADKGHPSEDASTLRSQIRQAIKAASASNRLPPPEVRKLAYKPPGDAQRTSMDALVDEIRTTIHADRLPSDLFASIVKMVVSSDVSDARQKEKRERVKLEIQKVACRTARVCEETAIVQRSAAKVVYQTVKIGEKAEVVRLDEAFANLDTADIRHHAAFLDKTTAATENATATTQSATATTHNATATTQNATAATENATAATHHQTAQVTLATATTTQSLLNRCQQLDLEIKEAQLAEARTRASLAALQLEQAQAAAATAAAPQLRTMPKPQFMRETTFLSMPAVRPPSKKKVVMFTEGTKEV